MAPLDYIERFFSWLWLNNRGNDDLMFTKGPAFKDLPEPNIEVSSPDGGPSNTYLRLEHTQEGDDTHPTLTWTLPPTLNADADPAPGITKIWEYLVICEDADIPLPRFFAKNIFHSFFYHIPPTKTTFTPADVLSLPSTSQELKTQSGYRYLKNVRGKVYSGAKPLIGHGEHRYLYQVVALKEPLDLAALGESPSKARVAEVVRGRVAGWGVWVGRYERKE